MKCMEKHHINKQSGFHGQQPQTTERQLKTKATGQGCRGSNIFENFGHDDKSCRKYTSLLQIFGTFGQGSRTGSLILGTTDQGYTYPTFTLGSRFYKVRTKFPTLVFLLWQSVGQSHGSWHICKVNFVVSFIAMYNICHLLWHIL
jgi:hypothetical protein